MVEQKLGEIVGLVILANSVQNTNVWFDISGHVDGCSLHIEVDSEVVMRDQIYFGGHNFENRPFESKMNYWKDELKKTIASVKLV